MTSTLRPASALLLLLGIPLGAADSAPGLVGEYFADAKAYPAELKQAPTLVRIDKQVNFAAVTGDFYKSRLNENFTVRWSGSLHVEKAGEYQLDTESDDGSRLSIDGKLLVDNGGVHPMTKKAAAITLSAGDHALLLEFIQGGGEAGCRLLWTPPGGQEVPVPGGALSHVAGAEAKIAWDEAAWKKRKGQAGPGTGKYATMDHGPFVIGTFVQPGNICTNKGITVLIDKEHKALAVFDPELMRFSYAGIEAAIAYPAGRDGIEGQPSVGGEQVFAATTSTGYAKPGSSGDFADPRLQHLGNLPRDWASYHGLYLGSEGVVLSYNVGGAEVLELPGVAANGTLTGISRSLTLSGNDQPLTLLVAEGAGAAASADGLGTLEDGDSVTAAGVIGGGTFAGEGSRLTLTIPAKTAAVKLVVWHGAKSELAEFKALLAATAKPGDLHAQTKGGPARWGEPISLAGELGTEAGPYVLDTITVPFENPAKSYMRLTGHDFFKDGRAAVCTMDGDVWVVSGLDATLAKVSWKRYATGLFQPLGLRIVDDLVYVICRDRLVRLHDLNGDGEADYYESFNSDCPVTKHYHEFAMDLETDKEGNFYFCKGSNLDNKVNSFTSEDQGCMLKVSKDGSALSRYATGLREPNGMGGGDGYPLLCSDNQGNWTPVDRINLVKQGGFYGYMGTTHRTPAPATYDPPICWTPYDLDNSPGGLAWVNNAHWGPLKDKPIGLSYGKSVAFLVLMEELEGTPQGGIVFFPLHFASGTMRIRFNPKDDQLYVTGMRGWQTNAAQEGSFQRMRFTNKPVYMPTSLHIHHDAVEIGFDQALDPATAGDIGNYTVEQWNYRWTQDYGSKDYSVANPAKTGHDKVELGGVTLSPDKKSVTLKIAGLAPVMQMKVKIKVTAADGAPVNFDIYNTINKIPAQ
jgi:hypothetical protein